MPKSRVLLMVVSVRKRASFFVILLDARVLVVDVQRRNHALGDHAGTEPARRSPAHPAIKDELYLARPADVEILPDDFLEKHPTRYRAIQHLRQREFRLQDGQLVTVSGTPIRGRERMRQLAQPLSQQGIDLVRAQAVTDCLQPLGIVTAQHSIVERLETDPLLLQLPFGILMTVQAQLARCKGSTC